MAIKPTKIDINDWTKVEPIDLKTLRPQPERDVLLILGDGRCVFDDLNAFLDLDSPPFDVMLINHMAMGYPGKYQHYVCGDSHMKPMQQLAMELPAGIIRHCWNPGSKGFDVRWVKEDGRGWNGTTAALAVKIGITLDYMRIVLAGCPMDFSGHWYDKYLPANDNKLRNDHRHHLWYWAEMATRPLGRFIRSMSGNTAELFGIPDKEWFT
jgi:hypothetical protein